MTPADLERAKSLVLNYHRMMPDEPRFAACLIGTPPIHSINDLDAVYGELVKSKALEAVATAPAIAKKTEQTFGLRSLFRCRESRRLEQRPP
jgi:hypothetical protein